jgi:hypothetical protein
MDQVNLDYWYNQWHLDFELHTKLGIKNVKNILSTCPTSIYADTDSCDGNSFIKTQNSTIRIEDWYKENINNGSAGSTIAGHESVLTNDKILNYSENGELFFTPVKRIIRHKVSKPKWKLKTKSGKEIIITNDHSMIVFRDGLKLEVKPSEILKTDKILVLMNELEYFFDDIESCEQIGTFEDEYVYDVEVDDPTHTFIANDILIHNSLFVSFEPAINHCEWKNLVLAQISRFKNPFIILENRQETKTDNQNCKGIFRTVKDMKEFLKTTNIQNIVIDGYFVKSPDILYDKELQETLKSKKIVWNWSCELDFIQGIDHFRYGGYFKKCLEDYAESYGVKNREDFELERISESIINLAKKKYIQHIVYEDGIPYDRLTYIFPKGVELVRSSTPAFAREKIVEIVKYLFTHPDDFNIKDLLKLVKNLRKEFELADIDDISMQSSCSNYETKVLQDKDKLEFVSGAHFAVKSGAYYNYLLNQNKGLQSKYEFIKSGTKIKYYYCKNKKMNDMFAYIRGSYPIEFAPEVDYDDQFLKSILSPINSIIEPLGMPEITKRLSVVLDIFGGF